MCVCSIQRYAVIPLSTNSGLIGWVPHCDTLHALIRDYREKKKILLNIEHRIMLRVHQTTILFKSITVFNLIHWDTVKITSSLWDIYIKNYVPFFFLLCLRWLQTMTTWLLWRKSRCLSMPWITQQEMTLPSCCGLRVPAQRSVLLSLHLRLVTSPLQKAQKSVSRHASLKNV